MEAKSKEVTKMVSSTGKNTPKVIPEKVLLEWKAPSRVFKKRDRRFYTTLLTIILVLSLIVLAAGEFLLIGVMLSLLFIIYIFSTIEPDLVEYKITNKGVDYAGKFYSWEDLDSFFFSEKYGYTILNIDTKKYFPGRLFLIISNLKKSEVKKVLEDKLPCIEYPKENFLEKAARSLSKHLSLD